MKLLLTIAALLLLAPAFARADPDAAISPRTAEGQEIVHHLASEAAQAFVAQESAPQSDEASCDSAKENILRDLARLELSGAEELKRAKAQLEKSNCQNGLFAATLSLRSADHLNSPEQVY